MGQQHGRGVGLEAGDGLGFARLENINMSTLATTTTNISTDWRLETLTAPTTSTAWPTRTLTGSGLSSSSKVTSILGCMAVASPYSR